MKNIYTAAQQLWSLTVCVLLVGLIFPTHSVANDSFWTGLKIPNEERITQDSGKLSESCLPISLLYLFKYGNGSLNSVYDGIGGQTDLEKLDSIYRIGGKVGSLSKLPNQAGAIPESALKYEQTTNYYDIPKIFEATRRHVDASFENSYLIHDASRQIQENEPGQLLQRVHSQMSESLETGNPIIVFVHELSLNAITDRWEQLSAHFVLISQIQAVLDQDHSLSFLFRYYDPETGKTHQALAYEETSAGFNANWFKFGASGIEVESSNNSDRSRLSNNTVSPYLVISAPEYTNGQSREYQHRRLIHLTNFFSAAP